MRLSQSIVLVVGGLSQLESFDLKPDAPAEMRGEFRPIATKTPGIEICEYLPRLAERSGVSALVRSLTHGTMIIRPVITSCSDALGLPATVAWHDVQDRPHYVYRGAAIKGLF